MGAERKLLDGAWMDATAYWTAQLVAVAAGHEVVQRLVRAQALVESVA